MPYARDLARRQAIRRGLDFIYQTACGPENFEEYGFDYLSCFQGIAFTSKDKELRGMALRMGRERARCWRQQNPVVRSDADADSVAYLVQGSAAADRLGVPGKRLKKQLLKIAADFTASDFLDFDPAHEAPPTDVPEECECGAYNPRGHKVCSACKRPLSMLSSYAVWLDALVRSYIGERYGAILGASFAEVIKWLPTMRPYPSHDDEGEHNFGWAIYAITHVVYTLNDYSIYRLSKSWLPEEYAFLARNLKQAIAMEDPEVMGEFLDSLKSFGLSESHPLIRTGMDYLLSKQNPNGSWGDAETGDLYEIYHPTWTAIDGLREYAWRGVGLSFPKLEPLLVAWAKDSRRRSSL